MKLDWRTDYITMILVVAIVVTMVIGVIRMNNQAKDINQLIEAQSRLIFNFENTTGTQPVTFLVTCVKIPEKPFYSCRTERQ